MSTLDIGTLSGRIELVDSSTPTLDAVLGRIKDLDEAFLGLGAHIAESAAGYFTARAVFDSIREGAQLAGEAIADLTTEGAKNAAVVSNFQNLAQSAGILSDELLGNLRTATHGTVDDMTLIKDVSSDLTAGLHLTEAQFTLVGQSAYALAKATGKDEKEALETVNDALLTGRARGLAYLTGKIDQTAAEQEFAAKLGVTTSQLSAEGKLEGQREAIFNALQSAIGRVGVQTENLNDYIQQGRAWWANFTDELGQSVATSPKVIAAFNEIKDVLVSVFGGDKDELIQTLTESLGNFALSVADGFKTLVNDVKAAYAIFQEFWPVIETGLVVLGTYAAATAAAEVATIAFETATLGATTAGKAFATAMGAWEALDFASIGTAATSLGLLGEAALAALGPIGAIAAAAGLAFAAFKVLSSNSDAARVSTADLTKQVTAFHNEVMQATEGMDEDAAQASALAAVMKDLDNSTANANAETDKQRFLLQQTSKEIEAYQQAIKDINSVGADFQKTLQGIDGETVNGIEYYTKAGVSVKDLSALYKLTEDQVKAVVNVMKEEEAGHKAVQAAVEQEAAAMNALVQTRNQIALHSLASQEADEVAAIKAKYANGLTNEQEYQQQLLNVKTDYAHRAEAIYMDEAQAQADAAQASADKQIKTLQDQLDQQKIDQQSYNDAVLAINGATADKVAGIWANYEAARQQRQQMTDQSANQGIQSQNDHITMLESAWAAVGEAVNDQTTKVQMLDGEVLTVKQAIDRLNGGSSFTYDLTTTQGVEQYRAMNTAASVSWTDAQITAFAKAGGTLQQLIQMGVIDPYAKFGGTLGSMPSFADGGSGDFGTGTMTMLHGKEIITPIDKVGGSLGGTTVHNWYVNGDGTAVAKTVKNMLMTDVKFGRQLSALR